MADPASDDKGPTAPLELGEGESQGQSEGESDEQGQSLDTVRLSHAEIAAQLRAAGVSDPVVDDVSEPERH